MRGGKEGKERDQKIDDRGGRDDKRRQRQMRLAARKKAGVCAWLHGLQGERALPPEEERGELIALFCQTAFLLDRR